MVFNFSNLVQLEPNAGAIETVVDSLRDMADYYFYQCFFFFVQLSGIIPVVAAAFTLIRLSRFNELTAMLAAGVPILRVAAPIVLAGIVLNGLLVLDQEFVIPGMIPKLIRDHDEIHREARNWFSIEAMQDDRNGLLRATYYYSKLPDSPPKMVVVDIIERQDVERMVNDASGRPTKLTELLPVAHITADEAVWQNDDTQSWKLFNGKRVTGLRPEETRSAEVPCPSYKSNVTPEEIDAGRKLKDPTTPKRILKADMVSGVLAKGGPCDRPADATPKFAQGQRVRTRNFSPATHTRLPTYAKGKTGVVEAIQGSFVFPDTNAHGKGENPQWVYTVVFDALEIWGEGADPSLTVSIDAWESYLERA
jgi:hypothetical protein